jgi:hypothetical protein
VLARICATIALAILSACGPSEPEPVVGVSRLSGPPPGPPLPSATPRAGKTWPSFAAAKKWPRASDHAFTSPGHLFGRYTAEIAVNDVAASAYATVAPGVKLPVGAIVAEPMWSETGAPGPTFAMERGEAGWTYVEIAEDGLELRRGRLEPCVSCHGAMASQDELFGVPTNGR